MSELRWYQQAAVDEALAWMSERPGMNPLIVAPMGSGKSHIIAGLVRAAIARRRETRVLMMTHSQELILQNYGKLREAMNGLSASMGIYSAALGRREAGKQVVVGSPQSLVRSIDRLGRFDLIIVDECDAISHREEGSYRKIIAAIGAPVVGLTATPWRLGHGMITDAPAIFSEPRIEPVTILGLIDEGHLCPLRSKLASHQVDASSVAVRGGEYVERELQAVVDTDANNSAMTDEIVAKGADRRAWMVFCSGVEHAKHMAQLLRERGIPSMAVHGDMLKSDRDAVINDFKVGRLRCLTNVNILTIGFDHPAIDLIAMCRPTLSPRVYAQAAGRGMRPSPGKADCLYLDFVGAVATHGPITDVNPPGRKGNGDAPVRACPECHELVPIHVPRCPDCGYVFPVVERPPDPVVLHSDDIMGVEKDHELAVRWWRWKRHVSKTSGAEMLVVDYHGGLTDKPVRQWLHVRRDDWMGRRDRAVAHDIAERSNSSIDLVGDLDAAAAVLTRCKPPKLIRYRMRKGSKYPDVIGFEWGDQPENTIAGILAQAQRA